MFIKNEYFVIFFNLILKMSLEKQKEELKKTHRIETHNHPHSNFFTTIAEILVSKNFISPDLLENVKTTLLKNVDITSYIAELKINNTTPSKNMKTRSKESIAKQKFVDDFMNDPKNIEKYYNVYMDLRTAGYKAWEKLDPIIKYAKYDFLEKPKGGYNVYITFGKEYDKHIRENILKSRSKKGKGVTDKQSKKEMLATFRRVKHEKWLNVQKNTKEFKRLLEITKKENKRRYQQALKQKKINEEIIEKVRKMSEKSSSEIEEKSSSEIEEKSSSEIEEKSSSETEESNEEKRVSEKRVSEKRVSEKRVSITLSNDKRKYRRSKNKSQNRSRQRQIINRNVEEPILINIDESDTFDENTGEDDEKTSKTPDYEHENAEMSDTDFYTDEDIVFGERKN